MDMTQIRRLPVIKNGGTGYGTWLTCRPSANSNWAMSNPGESQTSQPVWDAGRQPARASSCCFRMRTTAGDS